MYSVWYEWTGRNGKDSFKAQWHCKREQTCDEDQGSDRCRKDQRWADQSERIFWRSQRSTFLPQNVAGRRCHLYGRYWQIRAGDPVVWWESTGQAVHGSKIRKRRRYSCRDQKNERISDQSRYEQQQLSGVQHERHQCTSCFCKTAGSWDWRSLWRDSELCGDHAEICGCRYFYGMAGRAVHPFECQPGAGTWEQGERYHWRGKTENPGRVRRSGYRTGKDCCWSRTDTDLFFQPVQKRDRHEFRRVSDGHQNERSHAAFKRDKWKNLCSCPESGLSGIRIFQPCI